MQNYSNNFTTIACLYKNDIYVKTYSILIIHRLYIEKISLYLPFRCDYCISLVIFLCYYYYI